MADLLVLVLGLMPSCRAKNLLLSCLPKWEVDPSAILRPTFWLRVGAVSIGPGAYVGPLNVIKDVLTVSLGADAAIGRFNTFGGSAMFQKRPGFSGAYLQLGPGAAITNRHYVDCSGGLAVGARTTVGGVKSTIMTHQIDLAVSRQETMPVEIGSDCFISSDCRILPGVTIADRVVLAMGSVVPSSLQDPDVLYAGVPASPLKAANNAGYVTRARPHVRDE